MIAGTRQGGESQPASMGLNGFIRDYGVNIRYRDPQGIK